MIAESVGREARRQLVGEVVRAWVNEHPGPGTLGGLRQGDSGPRRAIFPCWPPGRSRWRSASRSPTRSSSSASFRAWARWSRGAEDYRGFRGEEAFQAGVAEDQALDTVLPRRSNERAGELADKCIQLYIWDRLGCDNSWRVTAPGGLFPPL